MRKGGIFKNLLFFGRIFIPDGEDVDTYKNNIRVTGRCHVYTEKNGVIVDARISDNLINSVEISDDGEGSEVLILRIPIVSIYMIISVKDSPLPCGVDQFVLKKGSSSIFGDGKKGAVMISADKSKVVGGTSSFSVSDEGVTATGGNISWWFSDTFEVSRAEIDGSNFIIRYSKDGLFYSDDFDNEVSINADGMSFGDASQRAVIGEEYKSLLDSLMSDISDVYSKLTVPTAFGASGVPINSSEMASVMEKHKANIEKTLSKYFKIQ